MYYSAILPCALSAIVSYFIANSLGVNFPKYSIAQAPPPEPNIITGVIVLAVICGLCSILLCVSIKKAQKLYEKVFPNVYIKAFIGGLILVWLTYAVGSARCNGGGLSLIKDAFDGFSLPQDFILKIVFTALTLAAGFKEGEIVPTLVIGSVLGSFLAPYLGLSTELASGIGFCAVFCGAINCPVTAFVLGVESFGCSAGIYFLLACAVSYVCSGYYGLYNQQKIWFDKPHAAFIGRNAK